MARKARPNFAGNLLSRVLPAACDQLILHSDRSHFATFEQPMNVNVWREGWASSPVANIVIAASACARSARVWASFFSYLSIERAISSRLFLGVNHAPNLSARRRDAFKDFRRLRHNAGLQAALMASSQLFNGAR
jgi:hypothetical protein